MVPISSASCLPSARLSGKAAVLKGAMWPTCVAVGRGRNRQGGGYQGSSTTLQD